MYSHSALWTSVLRSVPGAMITQIECQRSIWLVLTLKSGSSLGGRDADRATRHCVF